MPTPLCLLLGQGHQHFLERLGSVPQERTPPARGTGRSKVAITEGECLREALFLRWGAVGCDAVVPLGPT